MNLFLSTIPNRFSNFIKLNKVTVTIYTCKYTGLSLFENKASLNDYTLVSVTLN